MDCLTELRMKKLQAEIDEITFRIETEKGRIEADQGKIFRILTKGTLKAWAKSLPVVVTVLAGVVAMLIQAGGYLEQWGRKFDFDLNKEMIDLVVNDLNSDKQKKRESAEILLSAYEKHAIPVLLWNLERVDDPDATITSLSLIKAKSKVKPADVIDPLIKSAEKIFKIKDATKDKPFQAIDNYILALGTLGKEKKSRIKRLLKSFEKKVESKKIKLRDPDQDTIKQDINNAILKLSRLDSYITA